MRLFDRLFPNRSTPAPAPAPGISEALITAIVTGELKRRELADTADARRAEIELKKLEMEMAHLAEIGEEKRKDAAERQRLRELRQDAAGRARQAKALKRAHANGEPVPCRVCVNGGDPTLSANEILWHSQGHREASPWPQQ